MFPHENLFVGDLGKTEQPLTSEFMTTPVTREIGLGNVAYETGLVLEDGEEILGCSLNGMIIVTKRANSVYFLFLDFDPVSGMLKFVDKDHWDWIYTSLGKSVPNELIARGIDWVMTNWFLYLTRGNIFLYRQVNESIRYIRGNVYLCTPQRNRAFAKGIPGGGYNPFTGELTDGVISFADSSAAIIPSHIHKMQGHGGDMLCDWPQTTAMVGGHVITDGFVIDFTKTRNENDFYSLTAYHMAYSNQRPMTPLEFYADGTEGKPVYAMDCRVASSKGKLYARGMLTMGEACLIPAAFGEKGYATEYFLYIANSHGYKSPYSPFANTVLEKDVVWENTSPMLLKDVNNPEQNFLAGLVTARASPTHRSICPMPTGEGILIPDGERYGIGQEVFYDPVSRMGLMLDDKGALFFCGDIANQTIARLDEYKCATMADWLAPAREIESLSQLQVISSFYRGTLLTNIERDFARDCLKGIELGLTWGVFEKKQDAENPDKVTGRVRCCLALRQSDRAVIAIEVGVPDDVDSNPFEGIQGSVGLKNPFNFKVLNTTESNDWEGVTNECVLYKTDVNTGVVSYGIINPETGDITEVSSPGNVPSGWYTSADGVFGLQPNGVVYPFPSAGGVQNFASTEQNGSAVFPLTYGSNGMTCVIESSSGTRIAWRHSAFGRVQPNSGESGYTNFGFLLAVRGRGDESEQYRLRVINENAPIGTIKHLGSDPVTDWQGRRKFQKVLTVWMWEQCLTIMRTDLDKNVFDFDAEMLRASTH